MHLTVFSMASFACMGKKFHVEVEKMKRIVLAMIAVTLFTGSTFAADLIEMKRGVKFDHKAHVAALKDCTKCHASADGGKIEGFGKELAHGKGCKGCHAEMKKGPTAPCKACHKQ